jgi:hypothetical protein
MWVPAGCTDRLTTFRRRLALSFFSLAASSFAVS